MNVHLGDEGCNQQELKRYLSGDIAPAAGQRVEMHLDTCVACREEIEALSASSEDWARTRHLLGGDQFDALTTELNLQHRPGHRPRSIESDILSREIQGWLDPTDDPQSLGRFAGYEIQGIIGHGGMGIVLKGVEKALNRTVAIKILAPRLATNGTATQRFAREAQAAAAVVHKNVIAIHRVDLWHGLPFLVMSYEGGTTLQKRIDEQGPLPMDATLRIGEQIASGLTAAHRKGLVHRDIKPANILLGQGVERVTITDFGLARAADDTSMTQTGVVAGTPQYMSPEQSMAQSVDARSDIFSLGSVMYTMATGRAPFRGNGSVEVLHRIAHESAHDLRDIDSSIPVWFDNLIRWMHEKSPDRRPQTAAEVRDLLNACLLHVTKADNSIPDKLNKRHDSQGSGKRKIKTAQLLLGGLALLIAATIIILELNKGTLTIESDLDNVPIAISQNGKQVRNLSVRKGKNSTRIAAGNYDIEIVGKFDQIRLSESNITLGRGGQDKIFVRRSDPTKRAADHAANRSNDQYAYSPGERSAELLRRLQGVWRLERQVRSPDDHDAAIATGTQIVIRNDQLFDPLRLEYTTINIDDSQAPTAMELRQGDAITLGRLLLVKDTWKICLSDTRPIASEIDDQSKIRKQLEADRPPRVQPDDGFLYMEFSRVRSDSIDYHTIARTKAGQNSPYQLHAWTNSAIRAKRGDLVDVFVRIHEEGQATPEVRELLVGAKVLSATDSQSTDKNHEVVIELDLTALERTRVKSYEHYGEFVYRPSNPSAAAAFLPQLMFHVAEEYVRIGVSMKCETSSLPLFAQIEGIETLSLSTVQTGTEYTDYGKIYVNSFLSKPIQRRDLPALFPQLGQQLGTVRVKLPKDEKSKLELLEFIRTAQSESDYCNDWIIEQ